MTRSRVRSLLIGLDTFIGVGAVIGGIAMLIQPDGGLVALSLTWLGGSRFDDYAVPGAALIVMIGAPFLFAAYMTAGDSRWGGPLSLIAGTLLVAWIGVQVAWIGYHTVMQPLTGAFGGLTMLIAAALLRATEPVAAEEPGDAGEARTARGHRPAA